MLPLKSVLSGHPLVPLLGFDPSVPSMGSDKLKFHCMQIR